MECEYCKEEKDTALWSINPYHEFLYGDSKEYMLCEGCYDTLEEYCCEEAVDGE